MKGGSADIDWLARLREHELVSLLEHVSLPAGGRLLEVGGGTGHQARILAQRGFRTESVDLVSSAYRADQVFPIKAYDGRRLPYEDASFDIIYSSNVLEHVPHLDDFEGELARVLVPGGCAVHVLPSHHWRLWTSLTHYPAMIQAASRVISKHGARKASPTLRDATSLARKRLLTVLASPRHGERGTAITEYLVHFRASTWARHFHRHGYEIVQCFPGGVFYTGNMLLQDRLPLPWRRRLAPFLGSSTTNFVLRRRR
jgi:SAM-dependent methyltransferase